MASAIAILVTGNHFHLLLQTVLLHFRGGHRGYHALRHLHAPFGSVLPAIARRTGPASGDVPGRCRCRRRTRRECRCRCVCGCICGAGGGVGDGDGDGDVDGWEARRRGDDDGLMPLVRALTAGEVALGVVHFRGVIICAWVLSLLLQNQNRLAQ